MQIFLVEILGFSIDGNENVKIEESNKLISAILEIRDFSRKNKNYEMSDLIREKSVSYTHLTLPTSPKV